MLMEEKSSRRNLSQAFCFSCSMSSPWVILTIASNPKSISQYYISSPDVSPKFQTHTSNRLQDISTGTSHRYLSVSKGEHTQFLFLYPYKHIASSSTQFPITETWELPYSFSHPGPSLTFVTILLNKKLWTSGHASLHPKHHCPQFTF